MGEADPPPRAVKLANYLFARLLQLGVRSIFGVPGDYNLKLLDYVEPAGLHWVGTCNELNAGYATDGYARINGIGALITTFGVGELSAINAIAGAYSERAPVVHIVGTPPRNEQDGRVLMHHTLNDGDHRKFAPCHTPFTVAQVNLRDPHTSPAQIDWALEQCLRHSRPVYIEIPDDMASVPVLASGLDTKISISAPPVSPELLSEVVAAVLARLYGSSSPVILVDGESRAMGILDELDSLVQTTNFPTWTTVFSKGLINETLPNVHGIYRGPTKNPDQFSHFSLSDAVLVFGPHYSDTNTYRFLTIPEQSVSITFTDNAVQIGNKIYRDVRPKNFLRQLLREIDTARIPQTTGPEKLKGPKDWADAQKQFALQRSDLVTQQHFYKAFSPFLGTGDVIFAETGTAGHGARDFDLPPKSRLFMPVTWLSIGYMLPATLGAGLAQRDRRTLADSRATDGIGSGRTILLIGDGSLQMTVQEISTMIRQKLNVLIILINNDGYTIERCIHGREQRYNDVASWRYRDAPSFFGANLEGRPDTAYQVNTFVVRTWGDMEDVLKDEKVQTNNGMTIVEVMMERLDAPETLLLLMEIQKERERAAGKDLE